MLSIFVHLIINFDYLKRHAKGTLTSAESSYRQFLFAVLLYYFSDIFWGVLYEAGFMTLTYIDTVVYFLAMVLSVFTWTRFVVTYLNQKKPVIRLLTCSSWLIVASQVILLTINIFSPIFFYLDENHTYVPLPARYLTLTAQIILFALTSGFSISADSQGI